MMIDAIASSISSSVLKNLQNHIQAKADFKALTSDLQAGNIAGAQQDFASLLQAAPQLKSELQTGQNTPQATALTSLSTALQTGDVAGAQSALTTLQQTMMAHRHQAGGVAVDFSL